MCSQVRPNHKNFLPHNRAWKWTLPAAPVPVCAVQLQPVERRKKACEIKGLHPAVLATSMSSS